MADYKDPNWGNINYIREMLAQKKKQQQAMELGKERIEAQGRPTTSTTTTERPFGEITKAAEIVAKSPEEWEEAGLATTIEGKRKRGTGILGTGWGFGSEREPPTLDTLDPIAKQMQEKARGVLASPTKTTTRTTGKFAGQPYQQTPQQFTGQPAEAEGVDVDTQMLIDEYNSTTDPARLQELENLLTQQGVTFQ